jgi:hypothetical protein
VASRNVLYYGKETPLPERVALRAGPLSLFYEAGDLRTVRLGDREVLRRVYVAIRDRNWGTVAPVLSNVQIEAGADSFRVTYDVENRQDEAEPIGRSGVGAEPREPLRGSKRADPSLRDPPRPLPIDFAWKGRITGASDGTIRFEMEGVARSTFLRARIGFCVLHPVRECAGRSCTVEHVDGTMEEGTFPALISPHQPFLEMRAITHEVLPGVRAEVRFEGDVFEMEDHRNWTDASYKTYCTPLRLPYPVEVRKGEKIEQAVTLTLQRDEGQPVTAGQAAAAGEEPARSGPGRVSLVVGRSSRVAPESGVPRPRLMEIGLGAASHEQALLEREIARLRALRPAHLRVDMLPGSPTFAGALQRASSEAAVIGAGLEVAIHLSGAGADDLEAIAAAAGAAPVRRWLVFHVEEKSTSARWVRLARERLASLAPGARFVGGADAYFAELNRGRPDTSAVDGVTFSINPQVHAFDNLSLVENLEAQAAPVESARAFAGGKPIHVSPVTLRPRFNPNAAGPEPEPAPGELPFAVDERQVSLFGAAWTLGSLKYLAESGVASATYYETTGWRGVMGLGPLVSAGLPEQTVAPFAALRGTVYPLYHILADVGEFAGGEVIPVASSDPLQADGLALRNEGRVRILVANMTPEARPLSLQLPPGEARVRFLDERTAEEAMKEPEAFRARPGEARAVTEGRLGLELLPYGVARVDVG